MSTARTTWATPGPSTTISFFQPVADVGKLGPNLVHGPKQVADIYLLALAVKNNGRLVALYRAIPLNTVLGAEPRHLVLL
jgi:hypothetical protein